MSAHNRNHPAESHEGLSLTSALHDCLACGVLVVNQHEQITSYAPAVLRLLGLPRRPAANAPLARLPAVTIALFFRNSRLFIRPPYPVFLPLICPVRERA